MRYIRRHLRTRRVRRIWRRRVKAAGRYECETGNGCRLADGQQSGSPGAVVALWGREGKRREDCPHAC